MLWQVLIYGSEMMFYQWRYLEYIHLHLEYFNSEAALILSSVQLKERGTKTWRDAAYV